MPPAGTCGPTRRTVLGATAVTLAGPLAGCTRVDEFIADQVFGQVNVINTTDQRLDGSLELIGPDEVGLIDDSLELGPSDAPDDAEIEDREPQAFYEDVFTDAGAYALAVEIDPTDMTPAREQTKSLQIDSPAGDRIFVFVGEELTESFLTMVAVGDIEELEAVLEEP